MGSRLPDEARDFFSWMAGAAAAPLRRGSDLQVVFGIAGEHDPTERELLHLPGWRGSRPVRVGNGAWNQRQLDVYGEGAQRRSPPGSSARRPESTAIRQFLIDAAETAAAHWQEPDQGIWEVRCEPQHFLYSKLMCWVALDRAVALADRIGAGDRVWR